MTAATSNNTPEIKGSETVTEKKETKSFFGVRYRNTVGANKKALVINSVFHLLGLPFLSLIIILEQFFREQYDNNEILHDTYMSAINTLEPFTVISFFAIIIALIGGLITAQAHFPYLYKKSQVDMTYALPLSSRQRFFADYLAGLTTYMAPIAGAVILSFAILGVGSVFVDLADFWKEVPLLFKTGMGIVVTVLQLYTLSVLILTFCGSNFEASFGILLMNGMIPAVVYLLWIAVIESGGYGMVSDSIMMKPIFACTSPLGGLVFIINYVPEMSYLGSAGYSNYTSMYGKWMTITLLVTAAYLLAAYFLYSRRKAEDVSKPYVYRSFFYILMTMVVFCIMSLFVTFDGVIGAGIMICAVGWFIMEVITRRGFKRFWTAPIGFAAAVAAVLSICFICKLTDGFGAARKTPSPVSVQSVEIKGYFGSDCNVNCRFTDKDVIKEATELQKNCISNFYDDVKRDKPDPKGIYLSTTNVSLIYTTYTGSRIYREYNVPDDLTGDLLKAVLLSDEYADSSADNISKRLYLGSYERDKYPLTISTKLDDEETYTLNESALKLISDSYRTDMKNMTEEELEKADVVCYIAGYFVLSSFDTTLDVLSDLDITLSAPSDSIEFSTAAIVPYPTFNVHIFSHRVADDSMYESQFKLESITRCAHSIYDFDSSPLSEEHCYFKTIDYAVEMADRCVPIIFNESPIALVKYGNSVLYLKDTPENREFLEEAMAGSYGGF